MNGLMRRSSGLEDIESHVGDIDVDLRDASTASSNGTADTIVAQYNVLKNYQLVSGIRTRVWAASSTHVTEQGITGRAWG